MARGSIVRRGAVYYIVYYVDGKQKWKAISPRKREAEQALAETLAAVGRGTFREPKKISFSDFAQQWLRDYAKVNVRATTFVSHESVIRRHLDPWFGKIRLTDITPDLVQRFQAEKLKNDLSVKTVSNAVIILKIILNTAVRWGHLHSNPAQHAKRLRLPRREMDFLQPEEIPRFLEAASPDYRALFTTAALTGMRRGELLGLQWGDIDWAGRRIQVRRALQNGQLVEPKSQKSYRTVFMSPTLQKVLKKHRLAVVPSDLDLVFCNQAGQPIDANNMVKREFHPALRRAGLKQIKFHDLRHTYASLLIHQGENVKLIQEQLGHASVTVTIDRYGHLLPGAGASAADRLDETVFKDSVRVS